MNKTKRKIAEAEKVSKVIQPMLKGRSPEVQGAVLADLLSIFLAGHAPQLREEILTLHIDMVRKLIPESELEIFGTEGHPARRAMQ
jgi:hypothetical protein